MEKINFRWIMLLYGKNVAREIIKSGRRKIYEIFIVKGLKGLEDIIRYAQEKNIKVNYIDKKILYKKLGTDKHQGIALNVEGYKSWTLDEFFKKYKNDKKISLCVLDSIQDPHNFGAIIRSCEIFGINGIIFSPVNTSDITDTVYKASSGALEYIDIIKVANINNALRELKKQNFWIYGFDVNGNIFLDDVNFDKKSALVFGSEGSGIRNLVMKNCDFLVKIRQKGKVNSLNVSNAVAVVAYEVMKQYEKL
ncbi:MAG: 23S rRNA (guanosine(2251)-2'-O)-methyltransferase RlmB [Candidatus Goldbacteria bacterium]|nr:23S rRNA (guanosine(2251)-2'-O)-methyltransferase RlmB [Candidatus Goldiibacteriota bacterium]